MLSFCVNVTSRAQDKPLHAAPVGALTQATLAQDKPLLVGCTPRARRPNECQPTPSKAQSSLPLYPSPFRPSSLPLYPSPVRPRWDKSGRNGTCRPWPLAPNVSPWTQPMRAIIRLPAPSASGVLRPRSRRYSSSSSRRHFRPCCMLGKSPPIRSSFVRRSGHRACK